MKKKQNTMLKDLQHFFIEHKSDVLYELPESRNIDLNIKLDYELKLGTDIKTCFQTLQKKSEMSLKMRKNGV